MQVIFIPMSCLKIILPETLKPVSASCYSFASFGRAASKIFSECANFRMCNPVTRCCLPLLLFIYRNAYKYFWHHVIGALVAATTEEVVVLSSECFAVRFFECPIVCGMCTTVFTNYKDMFSIRPWDYL